MTEEGSQRTVSRRTTLKTVGGLGAAGLTGLAGCTSSSESTTTGSGSGGTDSVKAAWLYISVPGDKGWSWAHDQGRKAVDEKFDWLTTATSAEVAPANAKKVIREYTNNDYDIIFGTTFEYMDPMHAVAKNNPDTLYEHCSGYKTRENMGRYFGRMYQARYLAGVAAGMVTEANKLGYVAAFPIPEVVRGINAFTLGAASVNPEVTTKVRWTNTWFDPAKEREAAKSLIDAGVDVMAQHQDSAAAVKAAANADIWATGYDAPMGKFAGDNYLTSPIWHWDVFYEPTVRAVKNGSWTSDFYYKGLNAGIVDIDEWGPAVPQNVKSTVGDKRTKLENGNLDVWAGSKFADKSQKFRFQKMGSFVKHVEGTVPSG
ncbi:MAG: BMP family ABC transporter substrate-binding protein [Haloarculaceae archaeon]